MTKDCFWQKESDQASPNAPFRKPKGRYRVLFKKIDRLPTSAVAPDKSILQRELDLGGDTIVKSNELHATLVFVRNWVLQAADVG